MSVLVGTSAWAEASLVKESGWYPKRSMKAAERMAYYAARFPLVEMDATYRFPPTPDLARQWVERTPDGFTMDVPAWSLLVGQSTIPASLWPDLQTEVRPETRDARRLYAGHLTEAALSEAWIRFRHAISPLHDSGRLGAVILQLPHWLSPGDTGRGLVERARQELPDYRLAAEFVNEKWLAGDACEGTLAMLEDLDVGFVVVDSPRVPRVVAAATELAVVRFTSEWVHLEEEPWRRPTRYSDAALAEWVPHIEELAGTAAQVHVIFSNCYRDYAVSNAQHLMELLKIPAPGPPAMS